MLSLAMSFTREINAAILKYRVKRLVMRNFLGQRESDDRTGENGS